MANGNGGNLSEFLWKRNLDVAMKCLQTSFIQQMIEAYADALQTIAETQPLLHTLVAHAPCVMLWAWLGDRMLRDMTLPNAYERVVIETFASEKEQVDNLQRILDRVGEVKMDEWGRLDEVFRRSMEFELKNFVDAGERAEEKEALKRRLL